MDLFGDPIEEEIDDAEEMEISAPPENLFTHPRAMNFCLGHEAIEKSLLDLYNAGRLPHALIFSGPQGIGKATLACRFARFLMKQGIRDPNQSSMFGDNYTPSSFDVSPDDPVFRRFASGGHADFFTAERKFDEAKGTYKNNLDVEEIRKIAPFLRMTSSEGGWRAVIVDDADTMTRNAQNALLKILEEPPKNSVLILIAHRAGALIPTIRSRSRFIGFQPLAPAIMKELLEKSNPALTRRDTETLIALAGGSFGKALHYAENHGPQMLNTLSNLLENAPQWKWLDLHKLADTLSGPGSDSSWQAFEEILQWMMRETARSRARGSAPPPAMPGLLKNSSLEELLKICKNLESHFNRADYANLDRRQTVLGAFSLISA